MAIINISPAGGGTPGGSTTQIQFNNSGVFGGDSSFTFDTATKQLNFAPALTTPAVVFTLAPNFSDISDFSTSIKFAPKYNVVNTVTPGPGTPISLEPVMDLSGSIGSMTVADPVDIISMTPRITSNATSQYNGTFNGVAARPTVSGAAQIDTVNGFLFEPNLNTPIVSYNSFVFSPNIGSTAPTVERAILINDFGGKTTITQNGSSNSWVNAGKIVAGGTTAPGTNNAAFNAGNAGFGSMLSTAGTAVPYSVFLTNKSGSNTVANDAVIFSTTANATSTTTTANAGQLIGVTQVASIADGSTSRTAIAGYATVNATASGNPAIAVGDYLATSTTAGRVKTVGPVPRGKSTLGMTTSALASGTGTVKALLFPGGGPSVAATVDTTGLTANVGASTLYAVPATGAGMYRVSAYLVTTTAASLTSTMPNAQVVYTDIDSNTSVTLDVTPILGAAGQGQSGTLAANTVGTVYSGVVAINAKLSTNIQYQTVNYASNAAGMAYALHIVLEAL